MTEFCRILFKVFEFKGFYEGFISFFSVFNFHNAVKILVEELCDWSKEVRVYVGLVDGRLNQEIEFSEIIIIFDILQVIVDGAFYF